MNESDYKRLEEYALQQGFKTRIKYDTYGMEIISFYPMETIDVEENIYLSVSTHFTLTRHKFLSLEEFRALPSNRVSMNWLIKFLEFRSAMARKDNEKVIIKIKDNQKIEYENERNQFSDAEESLDRRRKVTEDTSAYQASHEEPLSLDDYDQQGPESDDWDSANWEEYMGGPD